jgi:hypothetical protein
VQDPEPAPPLLPPNAGPELFALLGARFKLRVYDAFLEGGTELCSPYPIDGRQSVNTRLQLFDNVVRSAYKPTWTAQLQIQLLFGTHK